MYRNIILVFFLFFNTAQGAISLDRTRAIFNAEDSSIALNISNDNKNNPYIAQTWIEDDSHKKLSSGPLLAVPPLQRLEPKTKSIIKIIKTSEIELLPKDRETLFYFNLREIPPRSQLDNVLQIAVQTTIKLFYRPIGLKTDTGVAQKLFLKETSTGYIINNPTSYYVTIRGIGSGTNDSDIRKFSPVMIAPHNTASVKSAHFSVPYVMYINDFGGDTILKCFREGNQYIDCNNSYE